MNDYSLIPQSKSSSIFFSLASIALVILALIYFANIIKPVVIATLIWFIINQLKEALGRITIKGKALPASIRSILAFFIIFVFSYIVMQILIFNLDGIASSMPKYLDNLNQYTTELSTLINDPKYTEHILKWINEFNITALASSIVNSLSGFLANFAIILVYVVFFLIEDTSRKLKIDSLFPNKEKNYRKFINNLNRISKAISSYIWQKTIISLITGTISFVILTIMNIDYAFLWSFLIFVFNFVPYIGPLLSSLFPAIFAILSTSDLMYFIYVFAAMEGVQIILGNFIEPKMMGKGTNLGPVIVIISLAFWGMIWGIAGMILAIPITAVIVIILSQIHSTRYLAILLSEKGDITEMED